MGNWLIILGVLFVLFVITREYWCWYWKINLALKKIDAFTEQVQRNNFWLERIAVQLHYRNDASNVRVPENYKYIQAEMPPRTV